LSEARIDGLVVVGGNGSQAGAGALWKDGFPVVGIASTIDNDLVGSEPTIGVTTAANVALEAIDRIRTTASAHHRAFVIETMGRACGYLALVVGIAGGAEAVVIPEREMSPEEVEREIRGAYDRGKSHAIVVVAEGARSNADRLAQYFDSREKDIGFTLRVTKLGYVQRGGAPGVYDRILATRLGASAVELLTQEDAGKLLGVIKEEIRATPYPEVTGRTKAIDPKLFELAKVMAR
jgi:6-phosphofructokinase 1